jgi:hypothetical protein
MFRATPCSSSGESIVSIQHLVYVTLCRWVPSVQVGMFLPDLHTRRSPTQSDTYQMFSCYNWFFWWWAQGCSKHIEKWNKCIRIVHQVGYFNDLGVGVVCSWFAMTAVKSYCIPVISWWFTVPFLLQTRKLIDVYLSCAEHLIYIEDYVQLLLLNYEYCLKNFGVFVSWRFYV